jgi:soluble lytic murein transglycosylase
MTSSYVRLAALLFALGCYGPGDALAQVKITPLPELNPSRERTVAPDTTSSTRQSAAAQAVAKQAAVKKDAVVEQAADQTGPNVILPVPNPLRMRNPFVDKAVAALDEHSLSASDRANLKDVIRYSYRGKRLSDARSREKSIKDPTARKLAQWYRLRAGDTRDGAEAILAFKQANPHWPNQDKLRKTAELALFRVKGSPDRVLAFFQETAPVTGAGKAALAGAHLEKGNRAEAIKLIKSAWREHRMGKGLEKDVLKRFGDLLETSDHKARIDKMLYADRKALIGSALRTAKHAGKGEKKKIEARAAVIRRSKRAAKLLESLPEAARTEPGIIFARVQWRRRNKKEKEAWELLLTAPTEPALLVDLDEWWIERRINCRNALNRSEYAIAYRIASEHGPVSGKYYGEAKFLSGWIALRFLQQPQTAMEHFLALRTAASGPKEVARAEYWLGRASIAMKQTPQADEHFRNAAQITHSYYGQIARKTINVHASRLQPATTPEITEDTLNRLLSRDAFKAIGVMRKAGLERLNRIFYYQLARSLKEADEVALVAEIARHFDHVQASVRLSKIALNRGLAVVDYAYPIDVFPDYQKLTSPVEPALLHALSRQESEFNEKAKSPVGARGLMQLMPRTARAVARSYKVRYHRSKLTGEPSYNLMLGAAHLSDLLDKFSGSYVKSLAAYNAGGGRVRQWAEQFGDPNAPDIDTIDWVERIPFTETRQYVKKIITTVQVYRARLEGPDSALRIVNDLNRGKPDSQQDANNLQLPMPVAVTP